MSTKLTKILVIENFPHIQINDNILYQLFFVTIIFFFSKNVKIRNIISPTYFKTRKVCQIGKLKSGRKTFKHL